MCLKSSAENVSDLSFVELPVLLNKVAQRVNDVPGGLYLHKLQHMQFVYTQTRPGGALHRLSQSNPLHVVAVSLAVVFADVPGLDYGVETPAVGSYRRPRRPTGSRQRSAIADEAVNSWPHIKRFLTTTSYFNAIGSPEHKQLLDILHALVDVVANREQLSTVLRVCSTEPDSPDADLHLLHGVLFLARHSPLAKSYKIHYNWCVERSTLLQDLHFSERAEFGFAFFPEQISEQRFSEAHVAAVNQVVLPYLCYLARLTFSPKIREMCFTAARVAQAHQDNA